jgi:putative acetyltransferase
LGPSREDANHACIALRNFEAYISRSLSEEIDRIADYYGERDGGFWVAIADDRVVGTFGLERVSGDAMELRRMYVDPSARRKGIAQQMLAFAEEECRRHNVDRLELSTSELQPAALASAVPQRRIYACPRGPRGGGKQ